MVSVFGNEIIGAFTNGVAVKEIYTYGELVWPIGWYVKWTPTDLSGSFSMFGSTYNLEDYSGYFSWKGSESGMITSSAFKYCGLTTMATNVEYVGEEAFAFCSSLTGVSLPKCDAVDAEAFLSCTLLSQIDLPKCDTVGEGTFGYCSSLSQASLPKCRYVGVGAFFGCYSLTQVSLPICTWIGYMAFAECSSLSQIDLPMCTHIDGYSNYYGVFTGCESLTQVSLPVCRYVGNAAFFECSSLSQIDLPMCSYIGIWAFDGCHSLSLLTLGSDSVVSIDSSVNTFDDTPFANCQGSILVPLQLLSAYKTAPGWSSLSCVLSFIPSPTDPYYIHWTPASISTGFHIDDVSYQTSDYDGLFFWSGGVITDEAFSPDYPGQEGTSEITYIETNAYSIGEQAFGGCSSMTQVSLPVCSYIGKYAFAGCYRLSDVSLPMCSYIGENAFGDCHSLTQISFPVCSYIGSWAFGDCYSLTQVNLPMCRYIDRSAFENCSSLTQVNLPMCSIIGVYAFSNCTSLSQVDLSGCEMISFGAFENCRLLSRINLPVCSYVGQDAFAWASALSIITLGSTSVCTLYGSTAFHRTSITSNIGSILVPASLVSAYKSASQWSYFKNRIFSIPT